MSEDASLTGKPVAESAINEHVYKVFPNDLNANDSVFGGLIMGLCDRLSLVVAERHSGRVCVTASIDSLHFTAPARANETLLFRVSLNRAWGSSMELGTKVVAENSYTGEHRHVVSAYMTFVALDEEGHPTEVPQVIPETAEQKRRFGEADLRRQARLDMRSALKDYREGRSTHNPTGELR
ncbi:acyl-CoA thioesterase [Marinobacteraceae bacterium S3BR75-40.1]